MDFIQKKTSSIYATPEFYFIETMSGYRMLTADPNGESFLLASAVSLSELGSCVLKSIAASRLIDVQEIPVFFDRDKIKQRYEKWVGDISAQFDYKNRREMFNKMRSCEITEFEGQITIEPTFHERLEGFSGEGIDKSDYVIISSDSSTEDVGKAVLLALSRCKGKGAIT